MALKDWALAPGPGDDPTVDGPAGQPERLRRMFARLPNTGLIDDVESVREFIDEIKSDPAIATPIGNALLGAHADSEGNIFISMFPDQEQPDEFMHKGQTNFEVLLKTQDASRPDRSINVDDIIDNSGSHFVHFKGCNIGKVPKFLKKFKEALDADHVTAPKFFHGLVWDEVVGIYEFMAYQFEVFQKTPFQTRTAVIDAFAAGNFKLIDGLTTVPSDRWQTWVPKNIGRSRKTPLLLSLGQTAGDRSQLAVTREFRVESTRKHPFTWEMPNLSPFPAPTAYLDTLRADVNAAPEFATDYGFPFHERWGYANPNAFVNGLRWSFSRGTGADANTLVATGTRSQYTLLVPIGDPADGHLFFNFHPHHPTAETPAIIQMGEDDLTFFGIV
jgi:hypothetical protein